MPVVPTPLRHIKLVMVPEQYFGFWMQRSTVSDPESDPTNIGPSDIQNFSLNSGTKPNTRCQVLCRVLLLTVISFFLVKIWRFGW